MRIDRIDAAFDGDNVSKKIKIYVDEQWRGLSVYLYFVPVVGDEVYTTANPITLDENGEAEYLLPGDVLNGEGCYAAQIVCIDTNGTEIAKSAIFVDECGASIDDTSAVLPTGEVITLAQLFAKFDSLTASEVGYVDTEGIDATNVQDAIDYALAHGGGGSIPTYTLLWGVEAETVREQNFAVINQIRDLAVGSYLLYLQIGAATRLTAYEIRQGDTFKVSFRGTWDSESDSIYEIRAGSTIRTYDQERYDIPAAQFDPTSYAAPSMIGTAEYINTRIGTTGNLDPGSYASADDVEAIEAVIPSAASTQNQLADKDFVNSSVATNTAYFIGTFDSVAELEAYSGTLTNNDYAFVVKYNPTVPTEVDAYDRYKYNALTEEWGFEYELNNSSFTAAQWAAINSAITSSLVAQYSAHVADSTIHVTSSNKTAWNAKYDKPSNGIPKTDLAQGVQDSLGLADTALQSVPSGYATETYVDTAIATAIGDAIGGSY